ncbi:MAG TPA: C40 family peptidase [Geomonas sp.]|nr:C40 family peptidase [Geomonas sp.]
MAIHPLATHTSSLTCPEAAPGKAKELPPLATGFESLLKSLGDGEASARPQVAAAELLGMEMMQHTLSLFGDEPAAATSPANGILERLLAGLAAGHPSHLSPQLSGPAHPEPALTDRKTGEAAGPQPEDAAVDGIARDAANYLGTPYRFGGEGPDGIDCSSLIQHVFRQQGIEMPRSAREQSKVGIDVQPGELRKGDLVFFHTYASYPSHVGIYLGDGKMIHASSVKGEVTISNMDTDYYRSRFLGARRIA